MVLANDTNKNMYQFVSEDAEILSLEKAAKRHLEITDISNKIRDNEVHIAKENSSLIQLEKFNSTLQAEIDQLNISEVHKSDHSKLKKLNKSLSGSLKRACFSYIARYLSSYGF